MDGTLLADNKEITPATVKAIKEAVSKGVIFTISTGRPIHGVEKYNKILELKSPIITYNGASIVKADTKEVLFSQTLLEGDALRILNYGNKIGITMCIMKSDRIKKASAFLVIFLLIPLTVALGIWVFKDRK